MGQIIIGIVGIIVGTMMVAKSEWLLSAFGRVNWAEAHLGTEGGTRIFYKLLGLITIFVSLLIMTEMVEGVIITIFSPLFPSQN
ncbi:MAG: hypothetical protein COX30_04090 [Candidatus Moranbacteria bacterium CG23_combo_of_CG06-09_8_20_14_all_39_10]|nr:MAG: hypothetical protein COX30_04090 [Candidatus Moranbacteria bacterium CG23_combo_of_CG06-09_8_20_14_all_39_10]